MLSQEEEADRDDGEEAKQGSELWSPHDPLKC